MTYPTQPEASHFVNGRYMDDETVTPLPVIYPATGEAIAQYEATPDVLDAAISAAQAAQTEWAKLSGLERGRVLRRAADIMRVRNHDLSVLETMTPASPIRKPACRRHQWARMRWNISVGWRHR